MVHIQIRNTGSEPWKPPEQQESINVKFHLNRFVIGVGGIALILLVAYFGGFFVRTVVYDPAAENKNLMPTVSLDLPNGPKQEVVVTALPSEVTYAPNEKVAASAVEELPVATKFKSFKLTSASTEVLSISGTCSDTYYAILIFRAQDDYRKDPSAAKMNRAAECPSSRRFSQTIALKDINLPSGSYYYFTADQGTSGSWYNPR